MAARRGIRCRLRHAIEVLERRLQLSGTPELVLDIETSVLQHSSPSELADVNGTLFFSAYRYPEHAQLWKSDGTAAGTQLVKAIRPGGTALITGITEVNGVAYFAAFDGSTHGLWKSDGTTDGTVLVKAFVAAPQGLTNVNGTLFFAGDTQQNGVELWKSDGTTAGTVLVKDIVPGTGDSGPGLITAVGNRVFFAAFDSLGAGLYVSDGTAAGTSLTRDIYPGVSFFSPLALTRLNDDTLLFAGVSDNQGYKLWRSDGTEAGTYMVKDVGVPNPYQVRQMPRVNGACYFLGLQSATGSELWKTDGTTDGTQIVKDIAPGSDSSGPFRITAVGNRVFFGAGGDKVPEGLWVSDGTADGTEFLMGVPVPGFSGYFDEFTDVNGTLYFRAYDAQTTTGFQLFRSDGTTSGTGPLIIPNGGNPAYLTNVNGTLFFSADDSLHGRELWKIDAPVDTVPPTVTTSAFAFENAHEIVIQFSENVAASLSASDLQITPLPGGPAITPSSVAYDAATNTATFAVTPRLGDGNYRATLPAGAVTDAAGNALAQDHLVDFFFLNGDANRDGRVNLQDFNILATHFGQSPRTFSQGDFNYDGVVNLQDFNLLAARFGQQLGPEGSSSSTAALAPAWRGGSFVGGRTGFGGAGAVPADETDDEWLHRV